MARISCGGIPAVPALALAVCALSACVQPPPLVVQGASGEVVPLEAWTASLTTSANGRTGGLHGSVMLVPGSSIRETQALVTLEGGTPEAVYPWYLQLGDCGNDRGILASLMAYPPIAVDESGEARARVTLPFTLPTSGRYFVSVRRSEAEVSTVIACGNLRKAGETTTHKPGYAKAP